MTIETFKKQLETDEEIFKILQIIKSLNLADCWLCAGTIRNYFWNRLSENTSKKYVSDIDVIFFDETISYVETQRIEKNLIRQYPQYLWELKNQVYMHQHNTEVDTSPYLNSRDAVSKFPEKCTAIAARLNECNSIELYAPYGIEDILNFNVSPTPFFLENKTRMAIYKKRVTTKNWQANWPSLIVNYDSKKDLE